MWNISMSFSLQGWAKNLEQVSAAGGEILAFSLRGNVEKNQGEKFFSAHCDILKRLEGRKKDHW